MVALNHFGITLAMIGVFWSFLAWGEVTSCLGFALPGDGKKAMLRAKGLQNGLWEKIWIKGQVLVKMGILGK